MKILLIANYQKGIGGISGQVYFLQQYLQQEGWQADIFSTRGNTLHRVSKMIQLLCKTRRYDALHIHACSYRGMLPAVMGIVAGKLWRKRTIITYHGGEAAEYFAKHIKFARRWLCTADQVVVLSGFLKEVFDQYAIPCVVIPNIVILQPQEIRDREIGPRFISVRHFEPLYNIPCILRAYEKVLQLYPNATLDLLGRGSMRGQLEQYVAEHQLTGVRFVGQVPNKEIYDYLAKADILLSSPRIDNMPVSVLEAMNAGLLVISSRVGGVPYMINEVKGERLKVKGDENSAAETTASSLIASSPYRPNKATGLLFESDNADELAEKMLWALEHPAEVQTIIANAQAEVQKYSWVNIRQQLMKLYE